MFPLRPVRKSFPAGRFSFTPDFIGRNEVTVVHIRMKKEEAEAFQRQLKIDSLRRINDQIRTYLNLRDEPCYLLADLDTVDSKSNDELDNLMSHIVGNFLPLKELIRTNRTSIHA